ncbi:type II toxin-antitoxin system RelE/ParE family toxin [Ethanoligenens harbinense]|uniref:Addiction module toxin, RelE/StbE family n=1 Tax=Ethanoligenens harbinense (strain DSM 18485 / JCM 12961 / CGMCC 1.5033 / YUAN-3) TaxID=663278 RepID=E6U6C9_ETHHY|nr:type II toxin-antitoxin system RelE/ParE family toxin [Ethanoligenens harbinense]ADU26896.1 addiction module toxin, RelE/StbE family [Ethanoligenens harbinense YUAN-3]AVQ95993.1 type II toxin-antitoxin system RelE/ParE family toxin [Ethanoligenens harbinense YUAN-3]AYF38655.1 type II toxin-antitoxin system RelE/ParE family toxin [Ethanoligenens harbinense]AYF41402.1 type II toxin-antitoxin system RelE/ParE family toxin [Ethanoligenens harbinense]QCN92235.1 type II toxin-antitoxin system Rel
MSTYAVRFTQPAADDLYEIARYIADELREPQTARALVKRIQDSVYELAELPMRYAVVADERLAALGIRKMPVESYLVFYTVAEEAQSVTVLRILHSRREWVNWL